MKKFIDCAKDLNKIMGLNPLIPLIRISKPVIIEKIKEAITELIPSDVLQENTIEVLKSIGFKQNKEDHVEGEGVIPIEATPEQEESGEEADYIEEGETGIDEPSLLDEVAACDHFQKLKKIVANNSEFKTIRGTITKYKTKKDLKTKMISMLASADNEEITDEDVKKEKEIPVVEMRPKVVKEVAGHPDQAADKKVVVKKEVVVEKDVIIKKTRFEIAIEILSQRKNTIVSIKELTNEANQKHIETGKLENLKQSRWSMSTVISLMTTLGFVKKEKNNTISILEWK